MKNLFKKICLFLVGFIAGFFTKSKNENVKSYQLMLKKYKEKNDIQKIINTSSVNDIVNKL